MADEISEIQGPSTSQFDRRPDAQSINDQIIRIADGQMVLSDLDLIANTPSMQENQIILSTELSNQLLEGSLEGLPKSCSDLKEKDLIFSIKLDAAGQKQIGTVLLHWPKNSTLTHLVVIAKGDVTVSDIKRRVSKYIVKDKAVIMKKIEAAGTNQVLFAAALLLFTHRRGISNLFKLIKGPKSTLENIVLSGDQMLKVMLKLAVKAAKTKQVIFPATLEYIKTRFPMMEFNHNRDWTESWSPNGQVPPLKINLQAVPPPLPSQNVDLTAQTTVERWGTIFLKMLEASRESLSVSLSINQALQTRRDLTQQLDAARQDLQIAQLDLRESRARLEESQTQNVELQAMMRKRCTQQTSILITSLCADRLKLPPQVCNEYTSQLLVRLRTELESIFVTYSCPINLWVDKATLTYQISISKILLTNAASQYFYETAPIVAVIEEAFELLSFLINSGRGHVLE